MGQVLHVLLAVGCLALGSLGLKGDGPVAVLVAFSAVPHALGLLARRLLLRGRFRAGARLGALVGASPVALFAAACGLLGWTHIVARWTGVPVDLEAWPHPAMLLALAPYALWAALAVDARARAQGADAREVRRQRRFHLRMLGAAFVPAVVFVLLAWVVGWSARARVEVEEVALWSAVFAAGLIAVFAPVAPLLLRHAWDTAPLPPGPLRDQLLELARRAGLRFRELLVWRTGRLVANAAILGLGARHRIVLFSDALLDALSPREIAAVFAHEAGHARHHHVLVFGAWTLSFLMTGDLVLATARPDALALTGVAVVGVAWFFVFGWLSRRYELEADLASLELTGDPAALAGALLKVGGPHARRASWRHFSVERRIAFLGQAAADPERGRALRRGLRAFARAGTLCFAILLVLQGLYLASRWPEDRVVVDLRLGRYGAAAERLAAVDEPAADVARLVAVGAEAAGPDGEAGLDELEEAARAALAAGRPQTARDLVELVALRGRALPAVAAALEGDGPVDALDEPWRRAFEAAVRR